jgi:hypothetical protein
MSVPPCVHLYIYWQGYNTVTLSEWILVTFDVIPYLQIIIIPC